MPGPSTSVHDTAICAPCVTSCSLLRRLLIGAAVLLERQTVVFCPNVGVLTSVVLSMIPLVRPFAWQSLLLPVLPCTEEMLDLLQVSSSCNVLLVVLMLHDLWPTL
jgi:DENN (AEX-3) domain